MKAREKGRKGRTVLNGNQCRVDVSKHNAMNLMQIHDMTLPSGRVFTWNKLI